MTGHDYIGHDVGAGFTSALDSELASALEDVKANQEKINVHYRRLGLTEDLLLVPASDGSGNPPLKGVGGCPLKVNDIQMVTSSASGGLEIFVSSGKSYQVKPSLTLNIFARQLEMFPQFIRTHESFIVNFNHLDYFSPADSDSQGRTVSLKNTGLKAPLTAANSDKVRQHLGIKSLEHVEPWNREYQAIIDENLRTFSKEIRFMSADELKENFKYKATGGFNIREFMANMIWEYFNLLQLGKRDPIEGNIRTFWYYLKPTLSKAITIDSQSQYGIMIDVFKELAVTHSLFKYKDFGFISDDTGNYVIGSKHPNIILAGEKSGHFKKLQRLQEEFGMTVISLGGMPSILNTEYLADDLEKAVNIKDDETHIIFLTDFNPSSAIISRAFVNQVQHEGVSNLVSTGHLLTPASFTPEELPHVTDQIPTNSQSDITKLRRWLESGGGVDFGDGIRKPLGIECEALILDFDRLRILFKKEFDRITGTQPGREPGNYDPLAMDLSDLDIDFFPL